MKNMVRISAMSLILAASLVSAQSVATTTTLTVTADGNAVMTVAPGTVITLTATVTAGGAAVTPGQVNFCDAAAKACADIHLLGSGQLIQSGPGASTTVLKFVPGAGIHSYKAVFLGTTGDAASSSDVSSLTVTGQLPTTTTIAQSGSPGNYTLTATVTGDSQFRSRRRGLVSGYEQFELRAWIGESAPGKRRACAQLFQLLEYVRAGAQLPSGGLWWGRGVRGHWRLQRRWKAGLGC